MHACTVAVFLTHVGCLKILFNWYMTEKNIFKYELIPYIFLYFASQSVCINTQGLYLPMHISSFLVVIFDNISLCLVTKVDQWPLLGP